MYIPSSRIFRRFARSWRINVVYVASLPHILTIFFESDCALLCHAVSLTEGLLFRMRKCKLPRPGFKVLDGAIVKRLGVENPYSSFASGASGLLAFTWVIDRPCDPIPVADTKNLPIPDILACRHGIGLQLREIAAHKLAMPRSSEIVDSS